MKFDKINPYKTCCLQNMSFDYTVFKTICNIYVSVFDRKTNFCNGSAMICKNLLSKK